MNEPTKTQVPAHLEPGFTGTIIIPYLKPKDYGTGTGREPEEKRDPIKEPDK